MRNRWFRRFLPAAPVRVVDRQRWQCQRWSITSVKISAVNEDLWSARSVINKITWQKAGRVTQPGRYMFTFGWLTVTAEDIGIWQQFPNATFTLVKMPDRVGEAGESGDAQESPAEEFHLGAFDIPQTSSRGGA